MEPALNRPGANGMRPGCGSEASGARVTGADPEGAMPGVTGADPGVAMPGVTVQRIAESLSGTVEN